MDTEKRFELIRGIGEECITDEELRNLIETKTHPIAYDGFEPSGIAHLPVGIYRPLLIKDLIKAGVHFKLWVADWFAWMNNKMDGDLEKIQTFGEYFIETWKAAGVNMNKVEVLWSKEAMSDEQYWKRTVTIARHSTLKRILRCTQIMGRHETDNLSASMIFYPCMQCSDIFHLEADIAQLGMDQRKVNMLAREVAPKLGLKKPIALHHHMLLGLAEQRHADQKLSKIDMSIEKKMSKSKPETSIFIHDSEKDIKRKINKAFCPPKTVQDNPLMDYAKEIMFRANPIFKIERPDKFGGDIEFESYSQLEKAYTSGDLHPVDLKQGISDGLNTLIKPLREHFEKNNKAKELYEFVKSQQVTR